MIVVCGFGSWAVRGGECGWWWECRIILSFCLAIINNLYRIGCDKPFHHRLAPRLLALHSLTVVSLQVDDLESLFLGLLLLRWCAR